jgi:hypothetical protein
VFKDVWMTADRSVLLARPHPFIVAEMRPLLERLGFLPTPVSFEALQAGSGRSAAGAIISTAISSSIPQTAPEIYQVLVEHAPQTPIAFAGLTDIAVARSVIQRLASASAGALTILGVAEAAGQTGRLGQSGTVIYVSKEDITAAGLSEQVARVLTAHFRR